MIPRASVRPSPFILPFHFATRHSQSLPQHAPLHPSPSCTVCTCTAHRALSLQSLNSAGLHPPCPTSCSMLHRGHHAALPALAQGAPCTGHHARGTMPGGTIHEAPHQGAPCQGADTRETPCQGALCESAIAPSLCTIPETCMLYEHSLPCLPPDLLWSWPASTLPRYGRTSSGSWRVGVGCQHIHHL